MVLQKFCGIVPLKNLPFGVPTRGRLPLRFCSVRRAEFKVVDRVKIDLQLGKLWCLKNLGDLLPLKKQPLGVPHEVCYVHFFVRYVVLSSKSLTACRYLQLAKLWASQICWFCSPLKNLPFWLPLRSRLPAPFLFGTSYWVQIRWSLADGPSIGKVMGPQNLVDLFPLKTPLCSAYTKSAPTAFLFRTSCWVQILWSLVDRPSIGKVMGPQGFVGFVPPQKSPLCGAPTKSAPYTFFVAHIKRSTRPLTAWR